MADHADHLTNRYGVSIDAPAYELSDYHVYEKAGKLVFSIASFPTNRDQSGDQVAFPDNYSVQVDFDFDSAVAFDNAQLNNVAGGRFLSPEKIKEDVSIFLGFQDGELKASVRGHRRYRPSLIQRSLDQLFSGTRAEVFQFGPGVRANRNFLVFSIDKADLLPFSSNPVLVTWATSYLNEGSTYRDSLGTEQVIVDGPYKDLIGRALKDQNPTEIRIQNALHPSQHVAEGFGYPDVVIYDTSKPSVFPNGRSLDDDIITYLSQFDGTTPPATSPTNRDGIDFAADAEFTFTPLQGIYADANRGDIRTSNSFPYLGDAYTIESGSDREKVRRFYDSLTGSYYYTSSKADIQRQLLDTSKRDDGYVFSAISGRGQAAYRFVNLQDGSRYWTASKTEFTDYYNNPVYRYEGETFFVNAPGTSVEGSMAINRLFNASQNRYIWTGSQSEISTLTASGWADQGVAWSV